METIKTGTLLIELGTPLPRSLVIETETYSKGWATVTNTRSDLQLGISRAGWSFLFLAGSNHARVFGLDRQRAIHTAVDRLIANAKSQNCNCLEIGEVMLKSFLGAPFVLVSAHSRQIQPSLIPSNSVADDLRP